MKNIKAPGNLRHLVHGIIRNAQGEYENLQPVSRKIIIERLNLFSKMNPSISPDWFDLSKSIKSKFFTDVDNVLNRLLKEGDIEEIDSGKFIADNPLKIIKN
tara:strand:+ start:612 stop:917 length:306 start_codon:yes stop_codon:yes gene_type:complete